MTNRGFSALELVFALSLTAVLTGVAVPQLQTTVDDYRAAGAVRYMAARFQRVRMEAIARSMNVAMQFVQSGTRYSYGVFVDGNGDGVRTRDILESIDVAAGTMERLSDQFSGVDFGLLNGLPPVEPGSTPPAGDPIKLGTSNLLSFSPLGTASSGSVYIRGRNDAQYVIRVFGETGRTRILKFDPRARQWKPL